MKKRKWVYLNFGSSSPLCFLLSPIFETQAPRLLVCLLAICSSLQAQNHRGIIRSYVQMVPSHPSKLKAFSCPYEKDVLTQVVKYPISVLYKGITDCAKNGLGHCGERKHVLFYASVWDGPIMHSGLEPKEKRRFLPEREGILGSISCAAHPCARGRWLMSTKKDLIQACSQLPTIANNCQYGCSSTVLSTHPNYWLHTVQLCLGLALDDVSPDSSFGIYYRKWKLPSTRAIWITMGEGEESATGYESVLSLFPLCVCGGGGGMLCASWRVASPHLAFQSTGCFVGG